MRSLMNLQILASRKRFMAFLARERLLTSMYTNVIGQLVFRFERIPIPIAAFPTADVGARTRHRFGAVDVVVVQMMHQLGLRHAKIFTLSTALKL